jgi:hypothetical protein
MTTATVTEVQTAEAPESFTVDATMSVWNVATIASMTRTVAKLEVKLAENDPAGHCAAKQLEEDIDALLLAAADSFAFDTSEIFRLQVQAAALHRYSVTRSSSDLRKAYGPSKLVYIHDGIEEDNTELSAA